MNDEEIKKILNDPKKLLDLFRLFHQLLHVYDAQEMKKKQSGTQEKLGLTDSIEIKVSHK